MQKTLLLVIALTLPTRTYPDESNGNSSLKEMNRLNPVTRLTENVSESFSRVPSFYQDIKRRSKEESPTWNALQVAVAVVILFYFVQLTAPHRKALGQTVTYLLEKKKRQLIIKDPTKDPLSTL